MLYSKYCFKGRVHRFSVQVAINKEFSPKPLKNRRKSVLSQKNAPLFPNNDVTKLKATLLPVKKLLQVKDYKEQFQASGNQEV